MLPLQQAVEGMPLVWLAWDAVLLPLTDAAGRVMMTKLQARSELRSMQHKPGIYFLVATCPISGCAIKMRT